MASHTFRIGGADLPDDWSAKSDVTRGEHESLRECVDQIVGVMEQQRLLVEALMAHAAASTAAFSHLAGLLVAHGVAK